MILQVLIIISIALQLVAAVVAIRLTRVTKYNISWLLFTLGLVLMCMIRLSEYIYVVADGSGIFLRTSWHGSEW